MPVMTSDTIVLSEDGIGALRGDVQISVESANDVVLDTGSQPGLYAYQHRPAVAAMFAVNRPMTSSLPAFGLWTLVLPIGGATADYTTLPFTGETFEDDGLGRITATILDATNGAFGPIAVAGKYVVGVTVHGGERAGVVADPEVVWQVSIEASHRGMAGGSGPIPAGFFNFATNVRPGMNGVVPPDQTSAKYPFTYGSQLSACGAFTFDAGDVIQIKVRQRSSLAEAVIAAPSASAAAPWIQSAYMYLVDAVVD